MHRMRIYVDTSVFGGALDEEFSAASLRFFAQARKDRYLILVSPATLGELALAPEDVRRFFDDLPADTKEELEAGGEADALAQAYVKMGAAGKDSLQDAQHVALATIAGADLILSWNFKHIVNYERIRRFNAVNLMNGYPPIDIRSPLEIGDED